MTIFDYFVEIYCFDMISKINFSLSSNAEIFFPTSPHFVHLKIITLPFLEFISTPMGTISPLQEFCLSPGKLSTCREHKQYGQWFLDV